jgi:transposase-like protein
MGQILHGSARTTAAVRRDNKESLMALSKRYSINPKTVAKWKRRTSVSDLTLPLAPVMPIRRC